MKKRILSFFMAIAMIFGLIPVNAYAASTPSLAYRWGNYDGQNYFEDTTQPLEQRISLSPSGNTMMFFYYTDENGKETQLDVSQLSIPNTNIATLERNQHNPNAVTIFPKYFGSTTVNYTTGGQTYSVAVDVELPVIGFYSTNQATQSSYISEFKVTETSNTIYLIGTHGWIFDRVNLEPDFEDVANITSIAGNVVEIKVTGTPRNNFWYHLTYDASNTGHSGTMKDQMAGISIKNGKGMFGYRWGDQNGDSLTENLNHSISDRLELAPGDSHSMFFYFDKDETSTRLNASDLVSSNTNIVRITESNMNPDAVEVWAEGFGTATIQYVNSGKTYSMDVEVVLPEVGFYSTPTASKASYINEFKLTETNDTFYLVSRNDWKFDSIRGGGLNEVTTITNHGSYLEFKAAEGFRSGQWYGIDYTMSNPNENWTRDEGRGITLRNTKPSLSFRYGNHENDMITENPNAPLNNKWETAPGYSSELFIYYVEDEKETRVALKDLTVSNEDVIVLSECKQNGDAVSVEVVGFGKAAISYTVNGKTYSIEVESGLPEFGFYTSKTPSKETYINEFTITEDTDTFYYVSTGDWEFTDARLREDAAHVGTVKYTPTYVEIQVTGDVDSGRWYQVEYELINVRNQDTRSDHRGIRIYEGRPSLSFRFGQYDNNQVIENLDWSLSKKWNAAPGDTTDLFMYYIADGKETRVKVDDLKVSNEDIIVLSECDRNSDAVHVEALKFGKATISYTVNGKTHSVEVEVGLPEVGFYTSQAASQATYIKEFKVTETNDTVYMVSINDWKFDSIRGGGFPEVATITNHGSYLEIKVTEDFQSGRWYGIDYTMSNSNESKVRDEGRGITLRDARPSLSFRYPEYENNQVTVNPDAPLQKVWNAAPGNSTDLFIYYIEDGNETNLKVGDLNVSDNNVIVLSECDRNSDAVHVEAVGFGPATISYTVNGKTHSIEVEIGLPEFGFYTSKTASKEAYLNEFKVTEDTNTFYFVSTGDWEFTNATLHGDFKEIATINVTPTYLEIQVTGKVDNGRGYGFEYELAHVREPETRTEDTGICIYEGRPILAYCGPSDEPSGHGQFETYLNTAKGYGTDVWVYFVLGDQETKLSLDNLKSSDEDVIQIVQAEGSDGMVCLKTVGWGKAKVIYTDANGKEYSFDVESQLQDFGYYKNPANTKENWLSGTFTLTDDDNTFYFLSNGGEEIQNLELGEWEQEFFTIELSPDKLCMKVTVKEELPRGNGHFGFGFETINGDDVCGHYYGTEIIDERTPIVEFIFKFPSATMESMYKDFDGNVVIEVLEDHLYMSGQAKGTLKDWFEKYDASILSLRKECSKFIGWTVYEFETAEMFSVPVGEELNIGDPDLTIIYTGQAAIAGGGLCDTYLGMWGCTIYEDTLSTDELMAINITKHHYVAANWEEAHDWETDFTVDKPATTTEMGIKSRHCKDCEEVTDITEIPMIELGGWKQDATGWWYENTDGSYTTANWQQIDGEWYYFNKDGYRVTDWQNIRGIWYYFDKATGIMAAETWIGNYYVNAAGVMQTGWLELSDGWYYLGTSGEVQTGWYQVRGTWYYGQTSGAQKGLMYVGLEEIDGVTYYFDSFGAMKTGWQLIGLDDYYFTSSGAMLTNAWQGAYYLGADGKMLTNAWVGKYYVGATGAYQTGWFKLSEGWYYLGTSGAVQTGWFAVGTTWYYGNPDSAKPGLLLEKVWLDDTYYFNADGAMVTGWYEINDAWYYFDASGAKVTSKWIGNYYLKADGTMAVSEWVENNKYYVGPDGVWIP